YGASINYYLKTPRARVTVTIADRNGDVVRTLEAQATAGQNVLTWDRRDQEGRTIPAGVYQVELTATTDEGEIVRLTRTARVD
ncbi:MAG: hypothetical protein HUU35_19320, partial [Armatimonadetes bacterium]|nr:hypothetical protein [Armatimonadota bacterium]